MTTPLSAHPTDIILEIVNFLELSDALSLLLTCSALYSLSVQRSFWISVLNTARNKSPIPCAPHTDLFQFTLEALKGLVFSWQKLQDNWNLTSPQFMQSVTCTHLSGATAMLFDPQGTDILVLSSKESVFCWDAKLAIPFPFPAIDYCGSIHAVSSAMYSPGVCTIVVSTHERPLHTAHRYVITIEHADGKVIGVSHEVAELPTADGGFEAFSFVTEDVVGSIVVADDAKDCIITVGPVSDDNHLGESTTVFNLHRSVSRRALIDCFAYKGHLYILLEDGLSVQIQHISRTSVRSGCCEESGQYICDEMILAKNPSFTAFSSLTPSTPFYGVSAVFIHLDGNLHDASSLTLFTFLTNTLTYAPDDGVSSPLAFDSPTVTEYVPAVVRSQSDPPRLVLVRYHPKTRSTSVHTLIVPSSIDLTHVDGLCVDESAGAVHLIDREGILSTMRYV
ncbi:hypothetical protein K438DRAFT_2027183 [Mycena galopus ATCC 62051]|nr:hypothetical protein K438DRAFT_2027183 [Mycena galopus ATCC 62051]